MWWARLAGARRSVLRGCVRGSVGWNLFVDERQLALDGGEAQTRRDVDDAQLIARSVNDPRAFEALFDRHYRRIHRFCSARAGANAADDLASETFVIAFRRRGDYNEAFPDALPWLYGIAINVLRAVRRRELLSRRATDHELRALEADETDSAAIGGSGALSTALRGLSERDRDLIVLFAWAGLTYEQLGETLGIPVGTVRSRLSRVRERLRRELEPGFVEEAR